MKVDMVMPQMGESITEGTILKWLKKEGDSVGKDEIILEISTDKVDSEIPTPVPGRIVKILAKVGDVVEVGKPIAVIETEEKTALPSVTEPEVSADREKEAEPVPEAAPQKERLSTKGSSRFYSPVVLNIAREHEISTDELERIKGTGFNGRVTKKDVLNYISEKEKFVGTQAPAIQQSVSSAGKVEIIPMDNMRKLIAEHMVHSKQTSAHVSLYTEVDMNNIEKIIDRNKDDFKKREGFRLTYTPFIVESTVKALKEFPLLNASIDGEKIVVKKYYNIGIAVAVENGLIVPNVFQADSKNLLGLARSVYDIAIRARQKKLKPDEIQNGTFSISNFGVFGTVVGFPIINQPQVAILGVGAVKKRPVVINDAIAIRPVMYLALTIDHRLVDGAMGSQFLEKIREYLENYDPEMVI
ncbi:MAG: 2-oxo acid dehydrogenase subunit E2 [Calditrichaeota bacterium]|nr:2-oxo acid dehydrogenase subunit E2 [Calditrichota bacterium]